MNKLTTKNIRNFKKAKTKKNLEMLTCYDYQTATLLNSTDLDLILVGDSLGNVILGFDTTVEVTLDMMILFSKAVKKGAPEKFVIADMPFGSYSSVKKGLESATKIFQQTNVEAVKLEGAYPHELQLIERLTQIGIPVMGHIGLTPQSVHELGGYYMHGKDERSKIKLMNEAKALEKAGCFSIVLECVDKELSKEITNGLSIPTIGIGSGEDTDGQVLVINDLLHLGKNDPPKFCHPVANLFEEKRKLIEKYLKR